MKEYETEECPACGEMLGATGKLAALEAKCERLERENDGLRERNRKLEADRVFNVDERVMTLMTEVELLKRFPDYVHAALKKLADDIAPAPEEGREP